MNEPLVTCLCLTMKGRGEFLERAIECFCNQAYQHKKLVIVTDSWANAGGCLDRAGRLEKGAYHFSVCIPHKQRGNVGQKRNRGCETVDSGLIAIWDDDDYSAPGRIAQQVQELQTSGKAVTGYKAMKFCVEDSGKAFSYWDRWYQFQYPESGFVLGTSLMFRRDWWAKHPFPEVQVGEDVAFCQAAAAENQLAEVPDLGLMYASLHRGNTSPKKVNQAGWTSLANFKWTERDRGIEKAWLSR